MASNTDQTGPKGLSRFIRRASKALRPKPAATSEASVSIPEASSSSNVAPTEPIRAAGTAQVSAPLVSRTRSPAAASSQGPSLVFSNKNTNSAIDARAMSIQRNVNPKDVKAHALQQQDKAKALFAKYGFTLETRDWTAPSKSSEVDWVEKKVRMRIHRQCHRCGTSFGAGKECANCSHIRCKSCPRFPPKVGMVPMTPPTEGLAKIEEQLIKAEPVPADAPEPDAKAVKPSLTERAYSEQDKIIRKVEAEKKNIRANAVFGTGAPIYVNIDPKDQDERKRARHLQEISKRRGVDVVYRLPVHRVRRQCHRCETIFKGKSTDCENCGHTRCPSCPREPAKFTKFPTGQGYPGDIVEIEVPEPEPGYVPVERVWRKPRTRVRWTCHECNIVFSSSVEKECKGCKHGRCDLCTRYPAKKLLKEHPEELLNGLEGKFVGLKFLPGGNIQAVGVEPVGC